MSKRRIPPAPENLTAEAAAWWDRIVSGWDLDDPGLLILQSVCETFDRMRQAQQQIKEEGATIRDRFGQLKQHPAVLTELHNRAAMLRNLKLLGLDLEPIGPVGRPPGR
jgi:P27 family predicted phage terminase small subunit